MNMERCKIYSLKWSIALLFILMLLSPWPTNGMVIALGKEDLSLTGFRCFASNGGRSLAVGDIPPRTGQVLPRVILAQTKAKRSKGAEYLYELGEAYFKQGSYQKAINYFQKVLLLNPGDKEAESYIVRIKDMMAAAKKRVVEKELIREERETEIRTQPPLGVEDYLPGQVVKEAREFAEEIERRKEKEVELLSQRVENCYRRGEGYYRIGQYNEAIEEFQKVLDLDPNYTRAAKGIEMARRKIEEASLRELRRQKEIEARAEREAERTTKREAEQRRGAEARARRQELKSYYTKGMAYYRAGEYERAIAQLQKVLDLDPNYTRAARGIEMARRRIEEARVKELRARKEAERRARQEAERKVREERQAKLRAEREAERKARKEEEARLSELRAQREAEERARLEEIRSYYLEGRRLSREGWYQEAIESFEKVIELEGNPRRIYTPSARRYIERAKQKIKEAEAKALMEKVKSHYRKGMDLYRENRYEEAIEEFQKALELDPSYTRAAKYIERSKKKMEGAEERARREAERKVKEGAERKEREEARLAAQRKEAEERARREAEEERIEYTIGEGDVLDISVWGWEDLAVHDAIVRPDGKISFPLVGDVQAVGLTLTELDRDLTERFKVYIRSPEVSVMLRGFGGKKVIVLGEVGSPGVYRVTGKSTILEVIALAGGPTEDAVLGSVILVRGDLVQPEARRVNLTKVVKKGDISENIAIQPEDIVYVPRKFIANVNYFLSQITPVIQAGIFYTTTD